MIIFFHHSSTYSVAMKTEVLSSLQKKARLLRWIMICALGLTAFTFTIIGRTTLIEQQPEPMLLPEYIPPTQHSDLINVENRINSFDYSNQIIPPTQMRDIRTELAIRRGRVASLCHIVGNEKSSIHTAISKMIVDTNHGLSWCPIYKAGSSTWMEHFAVLGRTFSDSTVDLIRRDILQVNTIARQAFPNSDVNTTLQRIKHTKKFLIVRHPFERLLSAYRDKLENIEGREYYYKKFGRHIAQRYRVKSDSPESKMEPSFTEFLRFIVEEKYFDEHWSPYSQSCRPCAMNYDYILKFETFKRDEDFLIQELGLNKYLYTRDNVRNVNPHGPTNTATSMRYFKNVPRLLLKKVHQVYEKDFKLFNYSPADYYFMTSM